MKGHLCLRVSPAPDGGGDRPEKQCGLSGLFVQVILCLLMSRAAINSSSARRGLIVINLTEGFQGGAGYWLNIKQGEQSLQDHTAKEPRGALCFLNPCHLEAPGPASSDQIISGHEPCSVNL